MNRVTLLTNAYTYRPPNYIGIREYRFTTLAGEEYSVQFVKKEKQVNSFLVDFSLTDSEKDEYFTTNSGDVYRKMATLVAIILDFLEKNTLCESIEFVPVKEDAESTNRRQLLFTRYARIFGLISGWKYHIQQDTFVLQSPKKK